MIYIFIFVIILILIIFIFKNFVNKHFWFKYSKHSLSSNIFFASGEFNRGEKCCNDLSTIDLDEFENLYKNYFPNVKITKQIIRNFFKLMPDPLIIYKKEDKLVASVFNALIPVKYKGNIYKSNFVDYGVVDKTCRNKKIYQGLMNQVSVYTTKMNVKFVCFKIDLRPIPSFQDYNMVSDYYIFRKKRQMNPVENVKILYSVPEDKRIDDYFANNFDFYPANINNFLITNDERLTFIVEDKVIFNLRFNSPQNLELLYIIFLEYLQSEEEVAHLIEKATSFINNNFNFNKLFVDGVGMNLLYIRVMSKYLENLHPTYHYILGMEEKLKIERYYYYF